MNRHTSRRKRRRAKMQLAGKGGVRAHKRMGGRTGAVHAKRQPAKGEPGQGSGRWPNPPVTISPLGEPHASE